MLESVLIPQGLQIQAYIHKKKIVIEKLDLNHISQLQK